MFQLLQLIASIIIVILNLLLVVVVVQVVISWLYAFNIIARRNPAIDSIWRFTNVITEPLLRPIRRLIPPVSGVDFAPMVLMLIIFVLRGLVPIIIGVPV
ncbi:MAG TPA: YggT family protein [Caulobacterales bacterium]|nr:YggT family protein [Caulobacterales bacterium]